jgi:hypothetical protein
MRSASRAGLRVLLVAFAAFFCALLLKWQYDEDRCADSVKVIFQAQGPHRPAQPELDRAVQDTDRSCQAERLRGAAAVLGRIGDPHAVGFARKAARRQPDDFRVWATLSTLLQRTDPAAAERARSRAIELNPLLAR